MTKKEARTLSICLMETDWSPVVGKYNVLDMKLKSLISEFELFPILFLLEVFFNSKPNQLVFTCTLYT